MHFKQLQNFVGIIKLCFVDLFWKFHLIANYDEVYMAPREMKKV